MARAFLGLGSDVGDRLECLSRAVGALSRMMRVTALSSVYETEPVGMSDRGLFYNIVAEVHTNMPPEALLKEIKGIERELGRKDRTHLMPREIDIDILLYDGLVHRDGTLSVPHPEMERRRFVLEPLAELAPDIVHPVSGLTAGQMLERCEDHSDVVRTNHTLNRSYASEE